MHDLTRSLPYSPEAEKAVLQHCFAKPADIGEVLRVVPEGAFHHPGNRLLFQSIGQMVADGVPVEYLAASNWLKDHGRLENVGGASDLSEIALDVGPAVWGYYRDILLDKWKAREVIEACNSAIADAHSQGESGSVDDWLSLLTERIVSLSVDRQQKKERTFSELVDAALDRYEEAIRRGGALPGISTGFPGLDRITGGKLPGQVWVIAGGTSDGKSAFAQQAALSIACQDVKVCLYTLEMPDDEVVDRFFSMHSKVDSALFKRGLTQRNHLFDCRKSSDVLRKLPITVRDVSGIRLTSLLADMRVMASRGVKHFMVDYAQLIEGESRNRSREEEVARVSRNMKATAKQLRVSIDLLSQLNDDGKLRESRAIGFDADVVSTISCPIVKEKVNGEMIEARQEDKRVVLVSKNRNGKRGVKFTHHFDGSIFTFTEQP